MLNFKSDFIYHRKNCLPKELCTSIIDFFEKNPNKTNGYVYSGINDVTVNKEVKDSTDISINFNKSEESCIFNMHHHLCEEIKNYKEKYIFLDDLEKWKLDEVFNIRRYNPGQAFRKLHCEHGPGNCSTRILAWMFYLNSVNSGGETVFPYQNKKFRPNEGDLLIWPAFWTHPHKGNENQKEVKYISTGWVSFH